MSGWTDVVTTALLGTDRRPLPAGLPAPWGQLVPAAHRRGSADQPGSVDQHPPGAGAQSAGHDPATVLLDLAAAHRAVARSGTALASCPPPDRAPAERLPRAPEGAQTLLGSLLTKPQPGLLNSWLTVCGARGLGVGDEHWTRLASVAVRATAVDRELLRRALGPRGVWFLGRQPQWSRLLGARPEDRGTTAGPAPVGEPGLAPGERQRLAALALAAVSVVEHPGSSEPTVTVRPPAEATGTAPESADQVHALLAELVAATELSAWPAHTGHDAAALVRLSRGTAGIWADALCTGWARAALAQRDEDWALALLEAGYVGAEDRELSHLIPVERRQALALSWSRGGNRPVRALELILSCPDPLPEELVAAVVELLGAGAFGTNTREVAVLVGHRLPLDLLASMADRLQAAATDESRLSTSMFLLVRQGFAALEQVVATRAEIADAFGHSEPDDDQSASERNAPPSDHAGAGRMAP